MSKLVFYRQLRTDGGIRTGIDVNGSGCWQSFKPGRRDAADPALVWYVDVRCEGSDLPTDEDAVRDWFLTHGKVIQRALRDLAGKFKAGCDSDDWPIRQTVADAPRGAKMDVVLSATDRAASLEMAHVLEDIARSWTRLLNQLTTLVAA